MKKSIFRYAKHTFRFLALVLVISPLIINDENAFINAAIAQEISTPPAYGFNKDHPIFKNAITVQNEHSQRLMTMQGVLGTGVGIGADGLPVIKVYLERAGIPNMPMALKGIPVKLQVTGMIVAFTNPRSWQPRPVPIGISTGHPDITAGTIGARVIDTKNTADTSDDIYYALSNNHVYGKSNDALSGDIILQPGSVDGGDVNNVDHWLGTLHDYEEIFFYSPDEDTNIISNTMDAAIALSDTARLSNSTPTDDGYGTPNSTTVVAGVNNPVQKYGRTTELTKGSIQAINVIVDVCYEQKCKGPFRCTCTQAARFENQFSVTDNDADSNTSFSAGGDSGSLIVSDDVNKNPVGLLFAGNSSTGVTFASPIALVLSTFGVTIDDTVGASTNLPAVTINSPLDGSSFNSGDSIAFNGNASDIEDGDISADLIWTTSNPDGQIGTGGNPSYNLSDGAHIITASVTDSDSNQVDEIITITVGQLVNQPPIVNIDDPTNGATYNSGTSINFVGTATDNEDGNLSNIITWTSDLDGDLGTGGAISYSLIDGTHTITASVTDSIGATESDSINVTVKEIITLSVMSRKDRGTKYADLSWSGASSDNVDIFRNGDLHTTTENDGFYTDDSLGKGNDSYDYQVCNKTPPTVCSDVISL